MEQSFSDSDVSMSPTKILDRLQVLRQLMLLQRDKLQKQGLQYQESPETTSNEFSSHFSNSTSYNTFKSLLESSHETTTKISPKNNKVNVNPIISKQDLLDGVSVLNISQESELIINSPASSNSFATLSKTNMISEKLNNSVDSKTKSKKQISLDEMPILSPKENFEALIIEKLQQELNAPVVNIPKKKENKQKQTRNTFLKRGEGMARFGVHKNDFVIQNTKSLPWRNKSVANRKERPQVLRKSKNNNKVKVQFSVNKQKEKQENLNTNCTEKNTIKVSPEQDENADVSLSNNCKIDIIEQSKKTNKPAKQKHPVLGYKAKTWAAVLTKEQDDFLHQLKQSDYYKNFASPAKSTISDISCDDFFSRNKLNKEMADQKMFELLENKVSEENFNLENSFFNRFLGRTKLETSGESTPLVLRKCLTENPELMCIFPNVNNKKNDNFDSHDKSSEVCEVCCSEECSSVCSECSCQTVESNHSPIKIKIKNVKNTGNKNPVNDVNESEDKNNTCHNDTITENNIMKANMADMNAKLIATSDLLKERLGELEDEIETFRKENVNLNKLRDEMDLERQKFYEDKAALEQKLNEEKILQEYYLSEEKEKISKQRQTYEKYIREMRLKVNKKEKDDVLNLKKEINDLKEDIRLKDAKYTSTIARLRNQIKIMEKEKKDFQEEIEKLKKENRRIQHSNDVTRRLSNIKYLEEINRKLSNLNTRETMSEVNVDKDIKYKAYEIERQSRVRKVQPPLKKNPRPRAKSAPNLNVTSRYAKYFSQRDATSQVGGNTTLHNDCVGTNAYSSDDEIIEDNYGREIDDLNDHSVHGNELSHNDEDNNLEKLYLEKFHSTSARRSNFFDVCSTYSDESESRNAMNSQKSDLRKSSFSLNTAKNATSVNERVTSPLRRTTRSNTSRSVSPVSILSNRNNCKSSNSNNSSSNFVGPSGWNRSESPISSTKRSQSPVVQSNAYLKANDKMVPSPEPSTSNTSLTKTILNPTEIKKPDGSKELRFPNGNIKYISADSQYGKFLYYNGDIKETFYNEGRTKYFYAELKTFHTTHPDGLEVLEFPDGQVEKRYKDGSLEVRLPNGSIRYFDPKNEHVREEWRFPDGTALTVAANGERRIVFPSGQVEVHAVDHKRREYPDGTVKLVYNDGTAETRYASGRVRIKDQHGNLIMDSASR